MTKKRIILKEMLEQLYIHENLSIRAIAKRLKTSDRTIQRNLDEHGIPRRNPGTLHKSHGMSHTRQYRIWQQLKNRCANVNHPQYEKYGAKGISYPAKWETFEGFWDDMFDGYDDTKTIDRIDGTADYSKTNCHWVDYVGQNRNKSDNVLLTFNGKIQCIAAWADEIDIPQSTMYSRKALGWLDEEILTTPIQCNR